MNYFAFSALLDGTVILLCGLVVLIKNPRGQKNLSFLIFCLVMTAWAFFYVLWQMSQTPEKALFYVRISIAFAALIPSLNFQFILKYLDVETPFRKKFKIFFFVLTGIIVLFSPTRYFIPRVEQKLDFPFWPVPGPLIHLHFINLFIPTLWTLRLIWEKRAQSSPLEKNKLKWVLISLIIGYACGMTNNFLWYNIPIKPYFSILFPIGFVFFAGLFFRLPIIDVNYSLRKILYYFLALVISLVCVTPLWFLVRFENKIITALVFFLSGSILFHVIRQSMELMMRRFSQGFGIDSRNLQMSREKLREATYTYDDLAWNLVNLTMTTFPAENTSIYFYDFNKSEFYLCAQKGLKNELARDLRYNRTTLAVLPNDPLVKHFESKTDLLHMEVLLNDIDNQDNKPLIGSLERLEGEICAPFIFGEKLRGFLAVGRKKDNTLYNDDEIDTIVSFANMGTEVMRYIMAMETELNHMALYSHDINHDIRSITQTLEFLRSPMAESQSKEKINNLLRQAEDVAERLHDSFKNNRERSTLIMKIIRGEYEKKPVELAKIITHSANKFILQAEKAGVAYNVMIDPIDKAIMGNEIDLTRMMDNLISNALRHLPQGGGKLAVTGRIDGNQYEIVVKDNGEGIEPGNLERIWELGWQNSQGKKGTAGFGLAIVKQIVQIHEGTVRALSQGAGTGVEFKIVLPLLQPGSNIVGASTISRAGQK